MEISAMKKSAFLVPALAAATLFLAAARAEEMVNEVPSLSPAENDAVAPGAGKGEMPRKGGPGQKGGEELRRRALEKFDANHDGKLDDTERAEADKFMREHRDQMPGGPMREQIIKRFDKDGDGKLNDEEKAAAEKALRERRGADGAAGGKMREEALKRFDKDGDGKLDDAERAEMRATMDKEGDRLDAVAKEVQKRRAKRRAEETAEPAKQP
jgi:Ca2+-binding EF-hand superfamily protein